MEADVELGLRVEELDAQATALALYYRWLTDCSISSVAGVANSFYHLLSGQPTCFQYLLLLHDVLCFYANAPRRHYLRNAWC